MHHVTELYQETGLGGELCPGPGVVQQGGETRQAGGQLGQGEVARPGAAERLQAHSQQQVEPGPGEPGSQLSTMNSHTHLLICSGSPELVALAGPRPILALPVTSSSIFSEETFSSPPPPLNQMEAAWSMVAQVER